MQIQINANGFDLTPAIDEHVRGTVTSELAHRLERLTRIEAHLGDHNGEKGGRHDKRCMLEARPEGLDPVAVTSEGADLYDTIEDAAGKLRRALDTRFGKLEDQRH
ncbi:MAG: HPF/RaiA family ribosome-associated protein [Planctomycetota bacterium]